MFCLNYKFYHENGVNPSFSILLFCKNLYSIVQKHKSRIIHFTLSFLKHFYYLHTHTLHALWHCVANRSATYQVSQKMSVYILNYLLVRRGLKKEENSTFGFQNTSFCTCWNRLIEQILNMTNIREKDTKNVALWLLSKC